MRHMGAVRITKQIEYIVKVKVTELRKPCRFKIRSSHGTHVTAEQAALQAFEKLTKWAERHGAETTLLENRYTTERVGRNGFLIVEITDPVAYVMEQLLKEKGRDTCKK